MSKLYLTDGFKKYNKKFKVGEINFVNAPIGAGKTTFLLNEFINNSSKYCNIKDLNKELYNVLYVCDNNMLKDSVVLDSSIVEYCKTYKDITEAKYFLDGGLNNKILAISYHALGKCLSVPVQRDYIFKEVKCIIFDELHNLFSFCNKYQDENLISLRDNLNNLSKNTLCIGLSATPSKMWAYSYNENKLNINKIFSDKEISTLKTYNSKFSFETNCIFNALKSTNWEAKISKGEKAFIYTPTVSQAKKYKEYFDLIGLKSQWLCSTHRNVYVEKETGKIIPKKELHLYNKDDYEQELEMTKEQLDLRDYLLNNNEIPSDLDVLIVNGAYETGWNLRDTEHKIQTVFIDSTESDVIIQARGRIRHDISLMWFKGFGEEVLEIKKMVEIDEKFIGVKLSKAMKDELVLRYAIKGKDDKEVNFKTFKRDIELDDRYTIEVIKGKGTYIYKKGEKITKKEGVKMNNYNTLTQWLINDWDKVRIPINEVRDNLDFGRKTWENTIKSDDFILFLKSNRIKIKTIPKMGKTLYFTKY